MSPETDTSPLVEFTRDLVEPINTADLMDTVRRLTDGLTLLHRLRASNIDDQLHWILPHGMGEGIAALHGLPVHHADVPHPMLAHRVGDWTP